jgi:hypothetical protein
MSGDRDEHDGFDDPDRFRDDADGLDDLDVPWPPAYPPGPRPAKRGPRAGLLAVTAVLAGAAGFGVVVAAIHEVSGSPAAASSSPSATAPGYGEPGNGQTLLPPQGGGGAIPTPGTGVEMSIQIGGRVTAVSVTSITIGGGVQAVTAAVTSATKVTGKVSSIGGVKVGDLVSATITGTDGRLTADTIQDPASIP